MKTKLDDPLLSRILYRVYKNYTFTYSEEEELSSFLYEKVFKLEEKVGPISPANFNLYSCALTNEAIDFIRSKVRYHRLNCVSFSQEVRPESDDTDTMSVETQVESITSPNSSLDIEDLIDLRTKLETLLTKEQQFIVDKLYLGYSHEEISKMMKRYSKSRVYRQVLRIREILTSID